MQRKIHVFDNGVNVYDDHLIPVQRERYKKRNVHEADEEDIFIAIINSIPAKGCFISIGAAIGYYPILARKRIPELAIHAMEPLERHRKYFIENMDLNGFKESDFILYKEGVSSSEGSVKFSDLGYGSSISSDSKQYFSVKNWIKALLCRIGFEKYKTKPAIEIRTVTLDNLIANIGSQADLVQMDVQGYELDVLKGASESLRNGNIKTLLIGTHGPQIHQDCMDLLHGYDYVIEFEEQETKDQPDGIIVASKGVRRMEKNSEGSSI